MRGGGFQAQKPESVLKRVEEYVGVGKKDMALTLIFNLLSNRRGRTWSQAHEKVMIRYLELCIEQKNSRYVKEGLHQFRSLCANQAPSSLEKVIEFLLDEATRRTVLASKECNLKTIAREVDDLENEKSPESVLLESVTADKTRERTEREILVPWLKFLWESFRAVVELLRNQSKLEPLYHATARRAFLFCEEYSRTTEFRRLCDLLRTHINPRHQRYDQLTIDTAESMGAHLETRFEQLRVASSLRIWHEGFRTIEDIHFIMTTSELRSSSKLLGHYYEKLTQLFLVSENYLFHAYAFKKYFQLSKEKKKSITAEAIKVMASGVLLSALSIPLQNSRAGMTLTEESAQKEKNRRMAQLLGFDINPKRAALLSDLISSNILESVFPEVKDIYVRLETTFSPLDLVETMTPLLGFLKEHESLSCYTKPIEKLLVIRLVSHLSRIFRTVKLDYFKQLLANLALSYEEVETTLIKAVKARQVGTFILRIDHLNGCLRFSDNLIEEKRTRPFVADLARGLKLVLDQHKLSSSGRDAYDKKRLTIRIAEETEREHQVLLERKELIEKRKEEFELRQVEKMKQEQEKQLEMIEHKAKQEQLRMQRQLEEREREMEAKVKEAEKLFEMKQELLNVGVDLRNTDLTKMTEAEREQLIKNTQKKQKEEAVESEKKLVAMSRRLDALVRVEREVGAAKINKVCQHLVKTAKSAQALKRKSDLEVAAEYHTKALAAKSRFVKMADYREAYEVPLLDKWSDYGEEQFRQIVERITKDQCLDKLERARSKLREAKLKLQAEEEARKRKEAFEASRERMQQPPPMSESEHNVGASDIAPEEDTGPWGRATYAAAEQEAPEVISAADASSNWRSVRKPEQPSQGIDSGQAAPEFRRGNAEFENERFQRPALNNSGPNRFRAPEDSESNRFRASEDNGSSRFRATEDSGSNRFRAPEDSGPSRFRASEDSGPSRFRASEDNRLERESGRFSETRDTDKPNWRGGGNQFPAGDDQKSSNTWGRAPVAAPKQQDEGAPEVWRRDAANTEEDKGGVWRGRSNDKDQNKGKWQSNFTNNDTGGDTWRRK